VVAAYLALRSAGLSGAVRLRHFGQRLWLSAPFAVFCALSDKAPNHFTERFGKTREVDRAPLLTLSSILAAKRCGCAFSGNLPRASEGSTIRHSQALKY